MSKQGYTQAELEEQLRKGGSVLHEGKLIRTLTELQRIFETPESIEAEIAELEQRARELYARRQSSRANAETGNADEQKQASTDDLIHMTKAQLLEKADELKVDASAQMTKAEIIEVINSATEAQK